MLKYLSFTLSVKTQCFGSCLGFKWTCKQRFVSLTKSEWIMWRVKIYIENEIYIQILHVFLLSVLLPFFPLDLHLINVNENLDGDYNLKVCALP